MKNLNKYIKKLFSKFHKKRCKSKLSGKKIKYLRNKHKNYYQMLID